ncbi:MAG: DUF1836 domain-containing protein [Clostridia bacterium]|nr:DUF1836 domain-containing protein [Clostridia bacterium]
MNRWVGEFSIRALPLWENLPDLELYMDQVISLLFKSLYGEKEEQNGAEKQITPSMINNYVKMGLIAPPVKKKYTRTHVATLLMICVLKQSLSIQEIKELFSFGITEETLPKIYNYFCETRLDSYQSMMRMIDTLCDDRDAPDNIINLSLFVSLFAVSGSAISKKLIALKTESLKVQKEAVAKKETKKEVKKADKE